MDIVVYDLNDMAHILRVEPDTPAIAVALEMLQRITETYENVEDEDYDEDDKLQYLPIVLAGDRRVWDDTPMSAISSLRLSVRKMPFDLLRIADCLERNLDVGKLTLIGDDMLADVAERRWFFDALGESTSVSKLDLCYMTDVDETWLSPLLSEALRKNTSIETLDLGQNRLPLSRIAAALEENTTVRHLRCAANMYVGRLGFQAFGRMLRVNNSLRRVNFTCTHFGDEDMTSLAEGLRENRGLTSLVLNNNRISDVGAAEIAEVLRVNESLISLSMEVNNIGNAGATAIASSLLVNSSLTRLSLYGNSIGASGAAALAHVLRTTASIQDLRLGSNPIDEAGIVALGGALSTNSSVTSLFLSLKESDSEGLLAMGRVLQINTTLSDVFLDGGRFTEDNVTAIADAIASNASLRTLSLKSQTIEGDCSHAIVSALRRNGTLTDLTLVGNIGDTGAVALAEWLRDNSTITEIDVTYSNIGLEGARAFAEALRVNNTLRSLYIYGNKIPNAGIMAIADALRDNVSLERLEFDDNVITDDIAGEFVGVLEDNTTLVKCTDLPEEGRSIVLPVMQRNRMRRQHWDRRRTLIQWQASLLRAQQCWSVAHGS
jgi:Ran GTPase-activating protein (RanGAP) involved in mRNA processing and transport